MHLDGGLLLTNTNHLDQELVFMGLIKNSVVPWFMLLVFTKQRTNDTDDHYSFHGGYTATNIARGHHPV